MKHMNKTAFHLVKTITLASLLTLSSSAFSARLSTVIDDFNNADNTNSGIERMFISDTTAGGKTTTEFSVTGGAIKIEGEIVPPRGQPGWSSMVLPLGPMGETQDVSQFGGILLLVKVNQGSLSISANSTEVTNYDYHAAPVVVSSDGKFHEVKVPFESMKRGWSEQTRLNTQTLSSLSIVAFSLQKATFDFEVSEVRFY